MPDLSPQQMGGDGSGGRWCPGMKEASAEFLSMPSRRAVHDVAADITVGPMSAGLLRRAGVGQPDPLGSGGGGEYVTLPLITFKLRGKAIENNSLVETQRWTIVIRGKFKV